MHQDQRPSGRSLFLSYARADRARVGKLADALRASGFDIWWDVSLHAGSEFSDDIARALDAADVIVVVWSANSIGSAWVRDEADVGRQRGRLVPVLIDESQPPLGFRQLHTIDLSGWRGRKSDPRLAMLVDAIAHIGQLPADQPGRTPPAKVRRIRPWPHGAALGAVSLLLALAAAFLIWRNGAAAPAEKPVIAVLPFTDMAAGRDAPYFAEGLAEEILDTLAADTRLKVLGKATARAIRDNGGDPAYARSKLGVTQLLEGSVRGGGGAGTQRIRVSVRLIDTRDGSEAWSQSFDRTGQDVIAVQEQVARAVATRIVGPLDAAPQLAAASNIPADVYEKVVVARQLIRERQADALVRARALTTAAIGERPDYAPAYAARALATALLTRYGSTPEALALPAARADAQTAIRLDPGLSEAYDALSVALWFGDAFQPAIAAANKAVTLRPRNADPHLHLAAFYYEDGQPSRAIEQFEAAAALDPLWLVPVASSIDSYGLTGQAARSQAVAARFRTLSVDAASTSLVDAYAADALGSYGRALMLTNALVARNPKFTIAVQLRDRIVAAIFASPASAGAQPGAAPAWQDRPAAIGWAYAMLSHRREADLARSFDARFGGAAAYGALEHPRFDVAMAVAVALAYDRIGRARDAGILRDAARRQMQRSEAAGLAPSNDALAWAALSLARGDRAAALATLQSALTTRWWAVCRGPYWIGALPSFTPLRGDPAFEAIARICRTRLNDQRRLARLAPAALD